jgi:two-component system, chemotaxis family, sensor kinase CheA
MDTEEKTLLEEEQEYLGDFIRSADKIITKLRNDVERFKTDSDDPEIINSLFRGFHNLKSSAYSLRLPNIRRIAHTVEDILELLRDKKISFNDEVSELLCESISQIDEVVISLFDKGIEGKSRVTLIIRLKEFLKAVKNPGEKTTEEEEKKD